MQIINKAGVIKKYVYTNYYIDNNFCDFLENLPFQEEFTDLDDLLQMLDTLDKYKIDKLYEYLIINNLI